MEIYLPIEIWSIILSNLRTRDLIAVRIVSSHCNHASLLCLKERDDIQITIRNDEDSKILKSFRSIFCESVIFNFVLCPISIHVLKDCITNLSKNLLRCTLNILIQQGQAEEKEIVLMEEKLSMILKLSKKLKTLEIIADVVTIVCKVESPQMLQLEKLCIHIQENWNGRHYTNITLARDTQLFFNSFLETFPNIKILLLYYYYFKLNSPLNTCTIPFLSTLKKLVVQSIDQGEKFYKGTLDNWLLNAPALEYLEHNVNFNMDGTEYLNSIQHIKYAKPYLRLCSHSVDQILPNIPGRIVTFEMTCEINEVMSKDITTFLSSQTETLEVLKIQNPKKKLEIPLLKKLHTFIYRSTEHGHAEIRAVLHLKPERFPKLKFVTFLNDIGKHPFTEVYPTVECLTLEQFQVKNWERIFPNLKSLKAFCRYKNYEKLLDFLPKVQSLELCLSAWFDPGYTRREFWNSMTRNAVIEPGTVFYIEGVNDNNEESKNENLPILSNLDVLKFDSCDVVHVKAIAYITLYYNFKTFRKLEFNIRENIYQTIPQEIIQILKNNHNVIFASKHEF